MQAGGRPRGSLSSQSQASRSRRSISFFLNPSAHHSPDPGAGGGGSNAIMIPPKDRQSERKTNPEFCHRRPMRLHKNLRGNIITSTEGGRGIAPRCRSLIGSFGRVGDLLFRAKHLFVTAIGSTSTRHWRQDSRPNRRQREAGGKCGGFHHLGPVLIDEPVKRPRPSGGRNRGHDYLCHYRRGPNFWPL